MRLAALVLVVFSGCGYTLSPPVRALHAGMPGLVSGRQLELGASLGGYLYPTVLVPHLALHLSDRIAVELGANGNAAGPAWLMGWAGGRLTLDKGLGIARKLYVDFELGTGMGNGGYGPAMSPWHALRASGIYGGFGVGLRQGYIGVYGRARIDWAQGELTPSSIWPSAIVGIEFRIASHLVFGAAAGYLGLILRNARFDGWMYQGQLRYFFDVPI